MFNRKIHYKWPFSIAMLNYQRVETVCHVALFWSSEKFHSLRKSWNVCVWFQFQMCWYVVMSKLDSLQVVYHHTLVHLSFRTIPTCLAHVGMVSGWSQLLSKPWSGCQKPCDLHCFIMFYLHNRLNSYTLIFLSSDVIQFLYRTGIPINTF